MVKKVLFTDPLWVPAQEIFFDFPSGCPNPGCTEDCEMIRFPRGGPETAAVLEFRRESKDGGVGRRKRARAREMCNWIECNVCFDEAFTSSSEDSESTGSSESQHSYPISPGLACSKCKLVKYCGTDHQYKDWDEHRRVCVAASRG